MYELKSRVRYSEVNSDGQLTLAALLDYLQDCCTFQSEDLEIGVEYLKREQAAWVVLSWEIEIARYPKFNECITVGTWPYEFKGFYGKRNFLVKNAEGEILVKVNSLWAFMDMKQMRPARIHPVITELYRDKLEAPLAGAWGGRKLAVLQQGEKKTPVQVARCHIDTNGHMNNGKYVQVAEEYLPGGFLTERLRVEYRRSAMLGDFLCPRVTTEAHKVTVVLSDEADQPYAVLEFLCG